MRWPIVVKLPLGFGLCIALIAAQAALSTTSIALRV